MLVLLCWPSISAMNAVEWTWSPPADAKPAFREPGASLAVSDHAPSADADLLRRMAEGDMAALGAFYDQHAATLLGLAYRILNDVAEAEDVLQEVLLQVWNKGGSYDPAQGRPLAWVLTLTRHKAIDRLRATTRRRARLVEPTAELPDHPASGADAAELARAHEQGELVRQALVRLPEAQRRAIELAFFDGLTQAEVAASLGEPLGTVKARIRRGMLKLREELEQGL